MSFWIGILVGGVFAWYLVKSGFFETWMITFNLLISVYLAVFLLPVLTEAFPVAGKTAYSLALTMLATAAAAFLTLHVISNTFFISQFSPSFPKVLDIFGAGLLGFLAGFLVWSFATLLICLTPLSQSTFAQGVNFKSEFEQCNAPYISWWCDRISTIVSRQDGKVICQDALGKLLAEARDKTRRRRVFLRRPAGPAEPNMPEEPVEPNALEKDIGHDNLPLPPPVY